MEKIKIYLLRTILKIFWVIPLKEKIFFSSYEGKQFSCNPRIIYQRMREKEEFNKKYIFIYEYNSDNVPEDLKNNRTKIVKHNSLNYIYHIMTSKYIITNSGLSCCFPLRSSQVNLNTWHGGGAYKKIGFATSRDVHGGDLTGILIGTKQTDYFISSSEVFTDIIIRSLKMDKEKILKVGMPRNDIFFSKNDIEIINRKVRTNLKLDDELVILYAPTYRGTAGNNQFNEFPFNVSKIQSEFSKKFKKPVKFLYRGHYYGGKKVFDDDVIDVCNYYDMQELLIATDVLITDYSSSIWDFGLSKRPCFLVADDLKEYDDFRGFESPIDEWPGILCTTEEELIDNIISYNEEKYVEKLNNYYKKMKSYENGGATDKVLDVLFSNK